MKKIKYIRKKPKYNYRIILWLIIANIIILLLSITYIKDLLLPKVLCEYMIKVLTLDIAVIAMIKDSIIECKMYSVLLNEDTKPKEDLNGKCSFTVFLNALNKSPYFVKITGIKLIIKDNPDMVYVKKITYSPTIDYSTIKTNESNIITDLPTYINIEIAYHDEDFVTKKHTGRLMIDTLFQYNAKIVPFNIIYDVECIIGHC